MSRRAPRAAVARRAASIGALAGLLGGLAASHPAGGAGVARAQDAGVGAPGAVGRDAPPRGDGLAPRDGSSEAAAPAAAPLEGAEGPTLAAFHAALERAARGAGTARIVLYGDSHTAAEPLPGALRAFFQSRFGDAGPGFVLPARPFPTYRAAGCEVRGSGWRALRVTARERRADRYGHAGVALEWGARADAAMARDSGGVAAERGAGVAAADEGAEVEGAWGELALPTTPPGAAWALELWAAAQPGGGTLRVTLDEGAPREVSLAAEQWAPRYVPLPVEGPDPHRLRVEALGDGVVRVFGAVLELQRAGVVLDALGLNGARAGDQRLWDDALFREQLARRRPDLVVLAYGTNEASDSEPLARYEASLREVVGRVRVTVPGASCVLVGATDRPRRVRRAGWVERPRQAAIAEAQRRVARAAGCAFFDTVRFQGGPLATVAWAAQRPPLAQRDRVHLTRLGYRRVAEALGEALIAGLPERPTGAGRAVDK